MLSNVSNVNTEPNLPFESLPGSEAADIAELSNALQVPAENPQSRDGRASDRSPNSTNDLNQNSDALLVEGAEADPAASIAVANTATSDDTTIIQGADGRLYELRPIEQSGFTGSGDGEVAEPGVASTGIAAAEEGVANGVNGVGVTGASTETADDLSPENNTTYTPDAIDVTDAIDTTNAIDAVDTADAVQIDTEALLEQGSLYVNGLETSGDLSPERASQLRADPEFLAQVGALAGDQSDPANVRAAEVLVSDVRSSAGEADRHLSELARSGALTQEQFKTLANDKAFLDSLLPNLAPTEAGGAPPAPATADRLLDQAIQNMQIERAPTDGANELYLSRDGIPFRGAGVPDATPPATNPDGTSAESAPVSETAPIEPLAPNYVSANDNLFPEALQTRLDAVSATPEGIDPYTSRGAQVLGGEIDSIAATERFAADSFESGAIDVEQYLAQINDDAFLNDPTTVRAAEVSLGTNPLGHTPGEDFLNSLYANGHIDQSKFIEHANDETFLTDTNAAIENGNVTYTTENYGKADELLGLSDEEIMAALDAGYTVGEGLPTERQVVALYEAGGRGDRQFTELGSTWVTEHNPDVELEYGHPDGPNSPVEFYFTKDGQKVSDPFLDTLTADLQAPDPEEDNAVTDVFHALRQRDIDDDLEPRPSVPVHVNFEGASGHSKDETTDTSRHTASLVFPGKDLDDVLGNRPFVGFDVDDHFAGGEYTDGIDGKARQVLEQINPDLFGSQITQIDGVDGLQVTNDTRFDNTFATLDDADNTTVNVSGNAGDLNITSSDADNLVVNAGSGDEQFVETPDGESPIAPGFAPDGVNASLTSFQQNALAVDAISSDRFVTENNQFDFTSFEQSLLELPGLLVGDRAAILSTVTAAVTPPEIVSAS